jgi:probable rRNA maturation factor
MIQVQLQNEQHVGVSPDVFNSLAKSVLAAAEKEGLSGDLALVFVDDKEIQTLNKQYRQKDTPTDVLSFSYLEDKEDATIGELIISFETAQRQAEEHSHDLQQEVEVLFVHGLLHILGYDHEAKNDLQEMLQLERKVLGDKSGLIHRSKVE